MRTSRWQIVQCQGCHGQGGGVDVILDDGSGPSEECGYCKGTGRTTRWMNCWIMRWRVNGKQSPTEGQTETHERIMASLTRSA